MKVLVNIGGFGGAGEGRGKKRALPEAAPKDFSYGI
jgi:hypothetical protein